MATHARHRYGFSNCPYEGRIVLALEELRGELIRLGVPNDWIPTVLDYRIDAERVLTSVRVLGMVSLSASCRVLPMWERHVTPLLGVIERNVAAISDSADERRELKDRCHEFARLLGAFLATWRLRPLCDIAHRDAEKRVAEPPRRDSTPRHSAEPLPPGVLDLDAFRQRRRD